MTEQDRTDEGKGGAAHGRTLVLMRHATAATDGAVADHDRPLSAGGVADAAAAGSWLRTTVGPFDQVLSSTARRTRETAEATGIAPTVRLEPAIYQGTPAVIDEQIARTDGKVRALLVVGHHPGLPLLAIDLASPDSDPVALAALHQGFPTAALAVFSFDGPWAHLAAGGARLVAFTVPRG